MNLSFHSELKNWAIVHKWWENKKWFKFQAWYEHSTAKEEKPIRPHTNKMNECLKSSEWWIIFFFFAFKWVYLNCSQSIAKSYSYRCLSGNSLRLNEKKISALYLRKGFLPFTLFSCWLKQFNEIINEICANQPISQVTCMHRVHNAFEKQFFFSRSFDSTIISWIISFNVRCVKHQA